MDKEAQKTRQIRSVEEVEQLSNRDRIAQIVGIYLLRSRKDTQAQKQGQIGLVIRIEVARADDESEWQEQLKGIMRVAQWFVRLAQGDSQSSSGGW